MYKKIKVVKIGRGNDGEIEEVLIDEYDDFFKYSVECEVPKLLGVNISVYRLFNFNENKDKPHNNAKATLLMIRKSDGFAPLEWTKEIDDAYVGRKDKKKLSKSDFDEIYYYIQYLLDEVYGSDQMDDTGHIPEKYFNKKFYQNFIKENYKIIHKGDDSFNPYDKPYYEDEEPYNSEEERRKISKFVTKNKFWSHDKMKNFNISHSREYRNSGFDMEMYFNCKKIYTLLGEQKYEEIKDLFKTIHQRKGFSILQNYFMNLYDSSNLRDDPDVYTAVKYRLENILEGIGGWLN